MATGLLRFGRKRFVAIIANLFVTFFRVLLSLQHQEAKPPTPHHYNGLSLRLVRYFKKAMWAGGRALLQSEDCSKTVSVQKLRGEVKDEHQAENRRHIPKQQVDIVCPPYEVVTCNCIVRNSTGDVVLRQPGDQIPSAGWWCCCYFCGGTAIQLSDMARDLFVFKQPLSFGLFQNWKSKLIMTGLCSCSALKRATDEKVVTKAECCRFI